MPRPKVFVPAVACLIGLSPFFAASAASAASAHTTPALRGAAVETRTGSVFRLHAHPSRRGAGGAAHATASSATGRGFTMPAGASTAPDGAGGTYVVWTSDRDGVSDVYLQRVTSAGNVAAGWPAAGLAVCTAPGVQEEAGLISDGGTGVFVGWADFRDEPFNVFGLTANLYVQKVNAAGTPQWTPNGVLALPNVNFDGGIGAGDDGAGGAFFAWAQGGPGDIYAQHIDASGIVTWNPAGVVVCDDTEDQNLPSVAPDGSGGCYVAWEDERGTALETYAQYLNAAGAPQWAANGVALTGGNTGYAPGVCSDGAGGMLAFWLTATDVIGQHYNSAGAEQWTPGGESVGTSSPFATEINPRADGSGGAYLVWRDPQANTVVYAQHVSSAGAQTWTSGGVTVCSAAGDRYVEDGYIESGGGLTLLWEDARDVFGVDLYAQKLNAAGVPQWTTDGVLLCSSVEQEQGFIISTDGAGGAVAAWISFDTVDPEPRVQHVTSAGVVQLGAEGATVVADPGVQRFAFTVPDGSGGTWVVWHEKVAGDYQLRAKRLDGNGSPLTGSIAVCNAAGEQYVGGVVPDGAAGIVIGWEDYRGGPEGDIYAQRISSSGVPLWTADGVVVCDAVADQNGLRMVSDGAGSAIFVWADNRTGLSDIYAQRLSSAGSGLWGTNGIVVSTSPSFKITPVIAPSGTNGAVIAWSSGGTYGQRLDGAGAPQWTAAGVLLEASSTGFTHYCADAVSDGADGAVVLYDRPLIDIFGTGDFITTELRMLRVNAAGASQWAADGVLLSDVDGYREGERLVSDGAGGAIAAWNDARGGVSDIYVQRVDGAGARQGGTGGLVACNASSWQWLSGLAADGAGGALLTWSDERSGFADVYAQHVNSALAPQWATNGVAVASAARGQYEAALYAVAGTSVLAWTDFRDGAERLLYSQKLNTLGVAQWAADGVTATLFSMVAAEADRDRVRVTWQISDAGPVSAYRRIEDGPWTALGSLQPDGSGLVTIEDRDVTPGARYAYRIGLPVDGMETFSNEVWIEVPVALALAIDGVRPQPARGDVRVSFTLPNDSPARLEVLDVAGRRVGARDLGAVGAGRHVMRVSEVPRKGGIYYVRVWQGGRTASARVVRIE